MQEIILVNERGEREVFVPKDATTAKYNKIKDQLWDKGVEIRSLRSQLDTIKTTYNLLDKELKEINHG